MWHRGVDADADTAIQIQPQIEIQIRINAKSNRRQHFRIISKKGLAGPTAAAAAATSE